MAQTAPLEQIAYGVTELIEQNLQEDNEAGINTTLMWSAHYRWTRARVSWHEVVFGGRNDPYNGN